MKLVKTSLRTSLKDDSVTDNMLIALHSEDISDFDPVPAVHLWMNGGKRSRRPLAGSFHGPHGHIDVPSELDTNAESESEVGSGSESQVADMMDTDSD